jgi:hypothetical protein
MLGEATPARPREGAYGSELAKAPEDCVSRCQQSALRMLIQRGPGATCAPLVTTRGLWLPGGLFKREPHAQDPKVC